MDKNTLLMRHTLTTHGFEAEETWQADELQRMANLLQKITDKAGSVAGVRQQFGQKQGKIKRVGAPGKAGHMLAGDIYLQDEWTDWTLAHELGHTWNYRQNNQLAKGMQKKLHAGKAEWIKKPLRRLCKRLEASLSRMTRRKIKCNPASLWYDPGISPPPAGNDRNFNESEDFAESFAAIFMPDIAFENCRKRAAAASRPDWDWTTQYAHFHETPRGQYVLEQIKDKA